MNLAIPSLIHFLLFLITNATSDCVKNKSAPTFEVDYQWTFINFTWENEEAYNNALATKRYIPENNAMAGIKFYKDKFYIAMPRICEGTPVTLGYISTSEDTPKINPLITPFPDWNTNDLTDHTCDKLENVQSMEIDPEGIMWVLDGYRGAPNAKCPPKLVLYDLNNNSNIIQTFTFTEQICLSKGGFLNDIVIDTNAGGFAYITDHSSIDPGLVVYSRALNDAWKLRDASMFAEVEASSFDVDNFIFNGLAPVDGIALSGNHLFYCALSGVKLYSLPTDILRNEGVASGSNWRYNVTYIGDKQAQSDGMVVDNEGNLYYGLLPLYGVGKWNINEPFTNSEILDENRSTMIWTDSFSFDDAGYLYLLANNIHKYFGTRCDFEWPEEEVKFRILRYFTGTKSYLYN